VPKTLDPKTCSPEDCVPCLFLPYSSARFLIFYLHSNAEDIGRCHAFCSSVRAQFQVHVLAVEYPGYGICPGGPCDEHRVTENAFVAFRFVREVLCWPLDSILILGRSIGCGPAISLAVRYQVSGVIVVSPMLSVREVCKDALGPLSYVVDERFPNMDRVPLIRSPFLVVHGQKDGMIPVRHGVELYGLCRSRKLLICPKDMEHNTNLLANVTYFVLPMLQFFSLPDYCFEDIVVPKWAYDKRLSPFYDRSSSVETSSIFTPAFGSDEPPDHSETPQQPTIGCLTCPAMNGGMSQDPGLFDSPGASFNKWLFGGHQTAIGSSDPVKHPWPMTAVTGKHGATNGSITESRTHTDGNRSGNPISSAGQQNSVGPRASASIHRKELDAQGKPAIPKVVPPPGAASADGAPPPPHGAAGNFGGPQPQPSPQAPLTPPAFSSNETTSTHLAAAPAGDTQQDTASRSRFQDPMGTPPWGPSMTPREPMPGEGAAPPQPPSPRPGSPSTSLRMLSPVDLVEIVEDLERHFANEGATKDMYEVGPRVPPTSVHCTPSAQWRSVPEDSPMLKHRSSLGSSLAAKSLPLSTGHRMGPSERFV